VVPGSVTVESGTCTVPVAVGRTKYLSTVLTV
jgi:hypothetical protein